MKTQQMGQVSVTGGKAIPQQGLGLALGAVLIGLLAVLYFANLSGPGPANTNSSAAARLEPGARSVADYLRAHSSIPEHAAPNPAAQSVSDYLTAHGADLSIRAQSMPNANVQSVSDYLRAHGTDLSIRAQSVPNANVQSVTDYLRAHGSIPDHASPDPAAQSDPALPSVLNYIRVHESIPDSVILELYRAHADRKD